MPLTKIRAGAYASGGVIQVQRTLYTGTTSTTCNTGTNTELSHLTVNITPTSTSSIIRIDAAITGEWSNVAADWNSNWFFYRDSTKLAAPVDGSRNTGIHMGTSLSIYVDNASSTPENAHYSYFDSPSTTSQITYKVGVLQGSGGNYTWYTNRTGEDQDNAQYERGVSFISVTEIAG
tara:strand:- start:55 stop:585 length:531 start_codon:yes stop_codon:yes gene_type:complete